MRQIILAQVALTLLLCSCGNRNAATATGQPHATVSMRDGTTLAGTVTASSPTEITVLGTDGISRAIPMTQVRSVEYDDTSQAAAAPAAAPASPQPAAAASPQAGQPDQTPVAQAQPQPAQPDATHEDHYHPPQSAIHTQSYRLAAGTEVSVRNEETIDSRKAVEGQTYPGEVTRDVLDPTGNVVIPRGSNAQIVIKSASRGGHFRGTSDLVVDLEYIAVEGQRYDVDVTELQQRGKEGIGANRRTAEYTGGGSAFGAIIGAIAGGGKGAAIGAGSGAAAGAITQLLTRGASIRIPAETILTFRLERPLHIVQAH